MAGYPFHDTTAANADDKGDKQPLGEGTVKTKPTGEKSRLLPSGGLCPFSVVVTLGSPGPALCVAGRPRCHDARSQHRALCERQCPLLFPRDLQ